MGHANTRMTFDTYGHEFDEGGRESAKLLESALDEFGISDDAFGLRLVKPVSKKVQKEKRSA